MLHRKIIIKPVFFLYSTIGSDDVPWDKLLQISSSLEERQVNMFETKFCIKAKSINTANYPTLYYVFAKNWTNSSKAT